ncbi:oligosaccharide flippase family protein [Pseudomonas palmensis]|uniref:oligosaccharide flippase family protein n=1 Tax=Pseudomonas palmensis TaxID=2815362 RepID=UPI0039EAC954
MSPFFNRVGRVLLGTMGAQLISLGVMLALVRLYSPEDIGTFSVWLSIATIIAVVVTGRYEMALFSGDRSDDTSAIVKLILQITMLLAVVVTCAVLLATLLFDQVPAVTREYGLALVLVVFGMGINKGVLSLLTLQQAFNRLGFARIALAACVALAQVVAGVMALGMSGLIYGQVAGVLLATLLACLWFDKKWLCECWSTPWSAVRAAAARYANFPKFSLPADLINTVASQMPVILIASRFGAESAGWFALTLKMMGAPVSLLAASVLDVFKEQAARDYRETGSCTPVFVRTFKLLGLMALPPFLMFGFFGEWAFGFFFGEQWLESGRYAVLMIPMFYMRFVISPLSYTIYIAQRQKLDLVWQLGLLAVTAACFLLGSSVDTALWSYSIGYAIMYVIYFVLAYRCARGVSA